MKDEIQKRILIAGAGLHLSAMESALRRVVEGESNIEIVTLPPDEPKDALPRIDALEQRPYRTSFERAKGHRGPHEYEDVNGKWICRKCDKTLK